ncbi:AAA family ATPase [Pyxidicoccus parkwayensis]|uniref:AAA family ATPase n=1 Tax=Pyxidicoccus parkwayensis TaxID=2813578 RepID=A0ABX7NPZ2_9BACT|nr:AAA domain-containing protein [Pyxidicoccus parkwaysis]QSQ20921.1 AAA family ATPase [Pyxidicoccus parkwaysis]
MRRKSEAELRKELDEARQRSLKPGLSREWARLYQNEVKKLEQALEAIRPRNRGAKERPSGNAASTVPEAADAPVEGYVASLVPLLQQLPRPQEVAGEVVRRVLPAELLSALEGEKSLYRPSMLKRVEGLDIAGDGLLSLIPHPAADPGWCGGVLMGFSGDGRVFSGEIVHMDAATGRIYATFKREPSQVLQFVKDMERWCYQPFDFSSAIQVAAAAYDQRTPVLEECLNRVHGRMPGTQGQVLDGDGPQRLWAQRWGLLWGPPGTGKTETLSTLLAESVRARPLERILAVAPTNRAVDNLALRVSRKLLNQGALVGPDGRARVFRGGVGISEELTREFPQVLHDPRYQALIAQVEQVEQQVRVLEARRAPAAEIAARKAEVRSLRKGINDETHFVAQQGDATLILITVHRALRLVSELAARTHFARVVVDEAGMVMCAASALLLPLGRQVTLAGDPKQIGPVCRVPEGAQAEVHRWLRNSPLSHLEDARQAGNASHVLLLREQHRMHPEISSVVSGFSYAGMLVDGEGPRTRKPAHVPSYPATRANWVVLDESVREAARTAAERGENGRGYQRKASAEVAVALATDAVRAGLRVLAVTPYRAQAVLLRDEGTRIGFQVEQYTASTIHRQQGTEFDVVLVDTVSAGRPFRPSDLMTMLNVAASRAREYLFVIASLAEHESPMVAMLLDRLSRVAMPGRRGGPVRSLPERNVSSEPALMSPDCLGAEIATMKRLRPLFTQEQVALFERRFDEGHHLVRGVAGSGKTFVLAHWVARVVAEKRAARVLVSFFNKALAPLMVKLIQESLRRHLGAEAESAWQRIDIQHVWSTAKTAAATYDAVFVDEAQDMTADNLIHLHDLVKPVQRPDGKTQRAFLLFMDDSQNVYGNKPIEEMKDLLPEGLNFSGRTRVLREAFRSTRQVLDLAFNVVLDPQGRHRSANPGMREFMRVQELKAQERLEEPSTSLDGLFHVTYTEREGVVPVVKAFESPSREAAWLVNEVRRLIHQERVQLGDIMVVSPGMPARFAQALQAAGVQAVAFGGRDGKGTAEFPVGVVPYVRATTIHSCKGHECPVVFFCGVEGLDTIDDWMDGMVGKSPRELERTRRSLFYVGATRAMVRQYVSSGRAGRFVDVASFYANLLASHPAEVLARASQPPRSELPAVTSTQ